LELAFVDRAAALLPQVPPEERELYRAKMARMPKLPPDHEVIGFRMFAQANSPEAIRAAVTRYPFLALPEYYPKIMRIIEESVDADSRPAFERRLGWLRAIPPDPWQEALQAFVHAGTDQELEDAVARHPQLARNAFAQLAKKALRDSPDWPGLARRLNAIRRTSPGMDRSSRFYRFVQA
jgi:hypothetical protein